MRSGIDVTPAVEVVLLCKDLLASKNKNERLMELQVIRDAMNRIPNPLNIEAWSRF